MIMLGDELEKILLAELKKTIEDVADEITAELYNNIKAIYSRPPSNFYDRTRDFLNAIIKPEVTVNGNTVSVTIGLDTSKIVSKAATVKHKFNAHMSVDGSTTWNGDDIAEAFLSWWDTGTSNDYFPELPQTNYWYEVFGDRGYKENPDYKRLNKILKDAIDKHFKQYGDVIEL